MISAAQLKRDQNALRGLFERDPKPRSMSDISLAGGEGLYPAVAQMVSTGELSLRDALYAPTEKLRKYKP